jgi:hypothetical protein
VPVFTRRREAAAAGQASRRRPRRTPCMCGSWRRSCGRR